jgi:hypothetical protein
MKHLHTEIVVDAAPDKVWAVLTAFDEYDEWNPFVTEVTGVPETGARLRVTLSPPGSRRGMTFRPTVTEVVPGEALEWWGHLGVRGIFDGRHRFDLHNHGDGATRLVQSELFTGLLVPLMARSLDHNTAAGFVLMNQAIKKRAEQLHSPASTA